MPNLPASARLVLLAIMAASLGGCAVVAIGSAAVSTASLGVKAATAVGGLAVDGASAAARAGAGAVKSDNGQKPEE